MKSENQILDEQIQYYKKRAPEYDEWFFRQDRYFLGEEHKAKWFAEIEIVDKALRDSRPSGNVLELACGTGVWTEKLMKRADKLTAVDASIEAIELCKKRLNLIYKKIINLE